MSLLAVFLLLILLAAAISARLERTPVTTPIVFVTAGIAAFLWLPGARARFEAGEMGHLLEVAELGLVLLLYTDASRTELSVLKSFHALPVRLLSGGMLLTILLGAGCALALFPHLTLWEAGILGSILAPTDAGLGQVIVANPRVPARIRRALNVEAGLNDGLSVPFLLFFLALEAGADHEGHASLTRFVLEQLGLGALIGVAIGLLGGWLLGWSRRRQWMSSSWQQLGSVTLPLLCVLAAEATGASMFIAAFVAGLAVQIGFREAAAHSSEFAEEWGQLLNLSIFFLFGMMVVGGPHELDLRLVAYAVLSLTVVRMLPVAVALRGMRLRRSSVLFMGWFGPRGLASIVLGLVYIEHASLAGSEPTIRLAVLWTVLLSVFAHGLSALPGVHFYSRAVASLPPDAPELEAPDEPAPAG